MLVEVESVMQLKALLPLLDEGIAEVNKRVSNRQWVGADLYTMALDGLIHLVEVVDESADETQGWFAWYEDKHKCIPSVIHVFAMYLRPTASALAMQEVDSYLEDQARAVGADRIRFCTERAGWVRRLRSMNYVPAAVQIERRID